MDFYTIREKWTRNGVEVYPDFKVVRSKDLMVRGRNFYAIWDEDYNTWCTDEYECQRLIDNTLFDYVQDNETLKNMTVDIKTMSSYSSNSWNDFKKYISSLPDNYNQLDTELTFQDTITTKKDHRSKRLPYSIHDGDPESYNTLMNTLYSEEEIEKIEWSIGAILSGDSKTIQKFLVLYGDAGAGKSTVLNIIQMIFEGYYSVFDAKSLTSNGNSFATAMFKDNPLIAIQHDGDLSKIEDNTRLNSIVSHEEISINEKYKSGYSMRVNCFLYMATNKPVKITDSKSGIIRRLIDVKPSGNKVTPQKYHSLIQEIEFELGMIANKCLNRYLDMGKNYYAGYKPINMMMHTDVFFNFIEDSYYIFKKQNGIGLDQAYNMYKQFCEEGLIEYRLPKYKFREELKNYFYNFYERTQINGERIRSYYEGFKFDDIIKNDVEEEKPSSITLEYTNSLLDDMYKNQPAQYASEQETPINKWEKVKTTLSSIDTKKLHYVQFPENHIVIDFDLKEEGEKSLHRNIKEASKWPPTYTELSKSGRGVHLHYIYKGDISTLANLYDTDIEIKKFVGNSALRRKLTKCNNIEVKEIDSGLPLKKGGQMLNITTVENEQHLRSLIEKALRKEIHSSTAPSIHFVKKILDDAFGSKMTYDVSDMKPYVTTFAMDSTNQARECLKMVGQMEFKSETEDDNYEDYSDDRLIFYDVEVFPNLFVVCWKFEKTEEVIKLINPGADVISKLMNMKLVGFNNRRYDNHILYAAYLGKTPEEIYNVSQNIINNMPNAMFREGYNISYTDVYDFSSAQNKMSLKKHQVRLGIRHLELGLDWNQPVPEDLWDTVAEYCCNDVISTEAVFNDLQGDWTARKILTKLSGLTANDTTNNHSIRIVFGNNRNTQGDLVYTDLSEMFPGYKFDNGISTYRDEIVNEGGYVYAEPGIYENVALLDVASMHPTSMLLLNLFGIYTERFRDLVTARLFIKNKQIDMLSEVLNGALVPFISEVNDSPGGLTLKDISNGLKTVINSAYGLTFAHFSNPFRDDRNIDNIVAKRGALFMVDLKHEVQKRNFTVAHIKTDSIKIPNATEEMIDFVFRMGTRYGYTFEHEKTYDKMALVNDAVYAARVDDEWITTGAQFAHPYVKKTLFTNESIEFEDLCELKSVTTSMYLKMGEDMIFVGRTGNFCPMKPGTGGGTLLRQKEDKFDAVGGTKGYEWMEAEMVEKLGKIDDIDLSFFDNLADKAIDTIAEYGSFQDFVEGPPDPIPPSDWLPWDMLCGVAHCEECNYYTTKECELKYTRVTTN